MFYQHLEKICPSRVWGEIYIFIHFFLGKIYICIFFLVVVSAQQWFNRKTGSTVRFSFVKIRISVSFMHLRSKLPSGICPKAGIWDGKTEQNGLKVLTLPDFFNKSIYLLKNEKHLPISYGKNKWTCPRKYVRK